MSIHGILKSHIYLLMMILIVSLSSVSHSNAQQSDMRMVDIGQYAYVMTGPGQWTEVDKSNWQRRVVFQEIARDANGVQIFDQSRNIYIAFNIPSNTVYLAQNGGQYNPQWQMVSYSNQAIIPGSSIVWDQTQGQSQVAQQPVTPQVQQQTQNQNSQVITQQQATQLQASPRQYAHNLTGRCSVVVLDRLLPYRVSSGTDNDVNQEIFGMMSDYYGALGDAASSASGASSNPKVGAALAAAGGGAKGFSAILSRLPALIGAIDSARDDADDLYMSLSTERGHEASFFPAFGQYTDRFTPGLDQSLKGISGRVVPYIFGVDETEDRIAVNFFDHDTDSRDDPLGQAIFARNQTGTGKNATLMMSEKHGGVVYVIEYQVVEVTCHPTWKQFLAPSYQGVGFSTLEQAQATTSLTLVNLGLVRDELAAKGIRF